MLCEPSFTAKFTNEKKVQEPQEFRQLLEFTSPILMVVSNGKV